MSVGQNNYKLWPANRLPIPQQLKIQPQEVVERVEVVVDEDDLFPKGEVVEYFPYQGYGYVVDRAGRRVYFNINEINFVGAKGKDSINTGSPVGYDLSWTSDGLRIKQMKVY